MLKDFEKNIKIAIKAHSPSYIKIKKNAFRFGTKNTPYSIHPIWCAMTILTETRLPSNLRKIGYQVLLFHDILEDSFYHLRSKVLSEVYFLIKEMTFANLSEEIKKIKNTTHFIKLLKLYDKTSNLLDASWMTNSSKMKNIKYTRFLIDFVESHYGELNITIISRNICDSLQKSIPAKHLRENNIKK